MFHSMFEVLYAGGHNIDVAVVGCRIAGGRADKRQLRDAKTGLQFRLTEKTGVSPQMRVRRKRHHGCAQGEGIPPHPNNPCGE
jgi:hypothetical protein